MGFWIVILLFISLGWQGSCHQGREQQPVKTHETSPGTKRENSAQPDKTGTETEIEVLPTTLTLLDRQKAKFPEILNELKTNKKKVEHWIWWVFPTEHAGRSEQSPKSKVELSQVDYILAHADMNAWSAILEEIYELLKAKNQGAWQESNNEPSADVLDNSDDRGRIGYALNFWLDKAGETVKKSPRFYNALKNLDKFKWPTRKM
ncbi:MAG TPA: DUF1810 family protein [Myxococcota bacterium]|nr:DUF1810 family protein [Myxococcota bacterium]